MSRIRNAVFGCALAIASAIAPISALQAMPLPAADRTVGGDVTTVQGFCYGRHCGWHGRRHYRPRHHYSPRRHYYRPRYQRPRAYGGRSALHVRWCLNRYRTYNPATNRYHAGGGVYPLCRSPYR